jgi:hypothetical protein
MAVTPWKAYHESNFGLRPEDLPRNTSARMFAIQANEMSQTTAAPIHHSIVATPPVGR